MKRTLQWLNKKQFDAKVDEIVELCMSLKNEGDKTSYKDTEIQLMEGFYYEGTTQGEQTLELGNTDRFAVGVASIYYGLSESGYTSHREQDYAEGMRDEHCHNQ